MKILIVEDSQDSLILIKSILKKEGYRDILTARSAQEAFEQLGIGNPRGENEVDLILMDIVMEGMDGIEACRQIKSSPPFKDVPVIMVTAQTGLEDLKKAFQAGATDYIRKPYNRVELLARVRSSLSLKSEMDQRKAREKELLEVTRLLEKANRELQDLAHLDGLTGIANRRRFEEYYGVEWRRAQRDFSALSLIMADIDYFKAYNDNYGHQAGDDCLKKIAKNLQSGLRRAGDLVARYGGEEFITVLPGTGEKGAVTVAEVLRRGVITLAIPHHYSRVSDIVTISLGVATVLPGPDFSPEKLVLAADQALYQAKEEGRDRWKNILLQEITKG